MKITIRQLECKRCGHQWVPRQADVRQCPKCKTAKWDVPPKAKASKTTPKGKPR